MTIENQGGSITEEQAQEIKSFIEAYDIKNSIDQLRKQNETEKSYIPILEANIAEMEKEMNSLVAHENIYKYRFLEAKIQKTQKKLEHLKNDTLIQNWIDQATKLERTLPLLTSKEKEQEIILSIEKGKQEEEEEEKQEKEKIPPIKEKTKKRKESTAAVIPEKKSLKSKKSKKEEEDTTSSSKKNLKRKETSSSSEEIEEKKQTNNNKKPKLINPFTLNYEIDETNLEVKIIKEVQEEEGKEEEKRKKEQLKEEKEKLSTNTTLSLYKKSVKVAESLNLLEQKRANPYYAPLDYCLNPACSKTLLVLHSTESYLVCPLPTCSRRYPFIDTTANTLGYGAGDSNSYSRFSYDRLTHLIQVLQRFEPRPPLDLQDEEDILDDIRSVIRLDRFVKFADYTPAKVRQILRWLKRNDLYKHAHALTEKLNGKKWPIMSTKEKWDILLVFLKASDAFDRLKRLGAFDHIQDQSRSSFLNYLFSCYKICELLGFTQYLPHLGLLRTPTKRISQDCIWFNICNYYGWKYIPSY